MGQHVVKYVNLTLLILYPISWFSPLMIVILDIPNRGNSPALINGENQEIG